MIEEKGLGGKKINRVNISLDNRENQKLNKLATACNMRPTTLARMLVEISLNDVNLIRKLQDEHGLYNSYKVVPVNNRGQIHYVLQKR